ncbi:MAG: hypothetical protein O2884_10060 [Chloroflexi bacterium]|nr:hypothetical protein [Chloroflexota bacterium]
MPESAMWDRIGAVSGILFAVLVVISLQVSLGTGETTAPTDVAGIVAIDYNQRSEDLRFGAFLMAASVFFLLWFLPFLRHRLERAQGGQGQGHGWMPSVAYGAGITAGAMLLIVATLGFAGSHVASFEGDWQVAKTLLVLRWDHLFVLAPPMAALVAATSVVSIRSGALPARLGWISLLLVFAPMFVAPELMTMLFLLWVIVVSVVLLYQTFSEDSGYLH